MLRHEWMRQRDRQIRRTVRGAEHDAQGVTPPDTALSEASAGQEDEPEALPEQDAVMPAEALPTAVQEQETESGPGETDDAIAPAAPEPMSAATEAVGEGAAAERGLHEGPEFSPSQAAPAPSPRTEPRQEPRAARAPVELPDDIASAHPSLRQRLEAVLARQGQLPLDIEARQAVSEGIEGSPRETREELVRRLLDPTLTLAEVAVLLDVCPTTVRRYTDKGVLRCFRTPGNQRRFHLSDVLDLMERQTRPS